MAECGFYRYHSRMVDPVINEADRDRLLKHLSGLLNEDPSQTISIAAWAVQVGLSVAQVRMVLEPFKAKGWVKVQGLDGFISITPAGCEQAQILRTPKRLRWMKDRAIVVPVVTGCLGAIITAIAGLIFYHVIPALCTWLFGPG
jgi:hypothetical protein